MSAYKIASLDQAQAQKIQELEKELDMFVLALDSGMMIAPLNEDQLAKVKQVEEEIGVTIVVYSK